jgi:hypothetical protein
MAGAAPRVEHFLQRLGPFDRPGARERIDLFDAAVGEGVNELTGDLLRRGALGERQSRPHEEIVDGHRNFHC